MIHITTKNRNTGEKKDYKFTQNAILIGRQQNCDIILQSTTVSRRHAKITVSGQRVEIEDLGSGNGTVVNQTVIRSRERLEIRPQDNIRIEEFDIKIDVPEPRENTVKSPPLPEEVTDPDIIEIKMIKKLLGALDQNKLPNLVVISGDFKDKKAVFEEGMDELLIGRDADCDLRLNSPVVSRRHATISIKWGGFVITDLGSKNGTFVNGEQVKEKSLRDGDEVTFGTIKALFRNPQEFDIRAISKTLTEQKTKQFEETGPVHVSELEKEHKKVSPAAKASAQAAEGKEQAKKKEEEKPPEKPKSEKKEPAEKPQEKKKKPPDALKELMEESKALQATAPGKRFTGMEWVLFGFGAVVMVIVIVLLVLLFI